jgi:transcription elongation factor Elf1
LGRRRKKVVRTYTKKRLPTVFLCPKCGKESIKITIQKSPYLASINCGSCGLKDELSIKPAFEEIDAYCQFTDRFYTSTTMV